LSLLFSHTHTYTHISLLSLSHTHFTHTHRMHSELYASIFTPSACGATEFRNLSTLIDVVVWNNMPKSEHTWLLKGMASDTLSR
uniref:Uncharacterized protein n=1 Tax=Astyanax mexicanus TaxID=7994 RepID=A0A8B9M3T1_ASTMX